MRTRLFNEEDKKVFHEEDVMFSLEIVPMAILAIAVAVTLLAQKGIINLPGWLW